MESNCNDCQKEKGVGWLVGSVNEKCTGKKWMGWEAKVCTNATAHLATDQTIRFQCLMLLLAKVALVVGRRESERSLEQADDLIGTIPDE